MRDTVQGNDYSDEADARWLADQALKHMRRAKDVRAAFSVLLAVWRGPSKDKKYAAYAYQGFDWLTRAILRSARVRRLPLSPAPDFDEKRYLAAYPDVRRAVREGKISSGFAHFALQGKREGRTRYVKSGNGYHPPDAPTILARLRPESGVPLAELHDDESRLLLTYYQIFQDHSLFDPEFYRATYLDGKGSDTQAMCHYLAVGMSRNHWPNAYFDPAEYRSAHPDVNAFGIDPIIHYALLGWREGRSPGSQFDGARYLNENPDVRAAGMSPLQHFLESGLREGKALHPTKWRLQKPAAAGGKRERFGKRSAGTILCVSHDMEVGGAQLIIEQIGKWLLESTKYDVKFVAMRGGANNRGFGAGAPVFNVNYHANHCDDETVTAKLREFAGPDVKVVLVNSVASGGFFDYWPDATPAMAYIHELPKVITWQGDNIEKIKSRVRRILAPSEAVRAALTEMFHVDPAKCALVYSYFGKGLLSEQTKARPSRASIRRELGIGDDVFVAMGCGVLVSRKSPDKFVEVAARVSETVEGPCRFVWVGGGPDEEQCRQLVRTRRLEHVVEFIGYRANSNEILRAADVFVLPSEEDPFPLVCLEAAVAGVPTVCFEGAGGMPEFVGDDCGVAVPFGDVEAMARAVCRYVKRPELCALHGDTGRAKVRAEAPNVGPAIMYHLREVMDVRPHVSVVVPSYNYGRFLDERLRSIFDQTFQDFELIMLDDASTDDSQETLRRWAERRPGTRLVVNDVNTGSPFRQWLKGIELAQSDLIWVAEADDTCDPRLLERLLPKFDDRNVFLAYAKSIPVGEDGRVLGDYATQYLDRINPGRWSKSYFASDHEEVNAALGIANSVPNASAVVFRSFEPETEFASAIRRMRMLGDWYFYLRALRGGLLAYVDEPLNYHRRHGDTVTHGMEGSQRYFEEIAEIRSTLRHSYRLSEKTIAQAKRFLTEDLDRFGIHDAARRQEIRESMALEAPTQKTLPSLLVVTSDLSSGGGQMFCIRLVNGWMREGGRVFLLNARKFPDHPNVVAKISPGVAIFNADDPDFSLDRLLADLDIDVIHSAIWWADRFVQTNSDKIPEDMPWLVTMHGCYETLLAQPDTDPDFPVLFEKMKARVGQWVYTAEKNRAVFDKMGYPSRAAKLDNGYEPEPTGNLSREQLGLGEDSFVLCLASRAIAAKGWREAVEAVTLLNRKGHKIELLLCGEGPEEEHLRKSGVPPFVHLRGHVNNVPDYVAVSDAGLLPSTFVGESNPLVMNEFLAEGKPMVASDVGDIRSILEDEDGCAGVVVPLEGGRIRTKTLASAIERLLDPDVRQEAGQLAYKRYLARFTMRAMLDNYGAIYAALLGEQSAKRPQG